MHGNFICGQCHKAHIDFDGANLCCHADHVICPISALPEQGEIGVGEDLGGLSYGSVYTGAWELVERSKDKSEAVRVYPIPHLLAKLYQELYWVRYQAGQRAAQDKVLAVLDLI